MIGRRGLAGLAALLLPAGAAQALEQAAATRALFAGTEDGRRGVSMACSGFGAWGPEADGLSVVVVPDDDDLRIALMRSGADGAPEIVAGPVSIEPITIDPLWSCLLDVDRLAPVGERPVIAVRIRNSYTSTGRSTSTEALHLLLRDGTTLRPIFGGLLSAAHSEAGPRGRRTSWQRRWVVVTAGRGRGGMPDLEVRDRRNNAVVSRHRWGGEGYVPPVFDRTPPLGPG
ncbi:hypothetical protein KPL78_05755 [Roseomonas sp. HJA6]|uniref:Uncharacterized protein n=1 Tax=Roseomonas alba TaxID=2846776 RepID=A0ABS7A4Z5_9PROT|nr:hypothetical protein [Neoroseomonas alba]MBW6397345.1 hypothetical protein [Neoroseomonas alba]